MNTPERVAVPLVPVETGCLGAVPDLNESCHIAGCSPDSVEQALELLLVDRCSIHKKQATLAK